MVTWRCKEPHDETWFECKNTRSPVLKVSPEDNVWRLAPGLDWILLGPLSQLCSKRIQGITSFERLVLIICSSMESLVCLGESQGITILTAGGRSNTGRLPSSFIICRLLHLTVGIFLFDGLLMTHQASCIMTTNNWLNTDIFHPNSGPSPAVRCVT